MGRSKKTKFSLKLVRPPKLFDICWSTMMAMSPFEDGISAPRYSYNMRNYKNRLLWEKKSEEKVEQIKGFIMHLWWGLPGQPFWIDKTMCLLIIARHQWDIYFFISKILTIVQIVYYLRGNISHKWGNSCSTTKPAHAKNLDRQWQNGTWGILWD